MPFNDDCIGLQAYCQTFAKRSPMYLPEVLPVSSADLCITLSNLEKNFHGCTNTLTYLAIAATLF